MMIKNIIYETSRSEPPIFEISPLIRKRQKIMVVIRRNGKISEKMVMSTVKGEVMRTSPNTKVRFMRLDPTMSPNAI